MADRLRARLVRGKGRVLMRGFHLVLELQLAPAAKAVAMALMLRAGPAGAVWASWERLALDTGLSRATVGRGLAQLQAAGVLERLERGSGYAGRANRYRFCLPPESQGETQGKVPEYQTGLPESHGETPTSPLQLLHQPGEAESWRTWASRTWGAAVVEGQTRACLLVLESDAAMPFTEAQRALDTLGEHWRGGGSRPYEQLKRAMEGLEQARDRGALLRHRLANQGSRRATG